MDNLGCVKGGIPRCRVKGPDSQPWPGKVSDKGPFGLMDPLVCLRRDGSTRNLNPLDFIKAHYQSEDGTKVSACICGSGRFPLCEDGSGPTCPDGSRPLRSITLLPPFLDKCDPIPDEVYNKN